MKYLRSIDALACISLVIMLLCFQNFARAATNYVDLNSTTPVPPYSSWSSAATNIQDAIDASSDGDIILVTNGVYQFGGRVMAGDLTNRVALYKPVTVRSVNGPSSTTIQGGDATNGVTAIRCAWLTNGAWLAGFTLQSGATRTAGDNNTLRCGGGAWCASSNATILNCIIVSNHASVNGSGIYQGSIRNCFLAGNTSAVTGPTAQNCLMTSCTVVSNMSAGVAMGRYTNCIIYGNFGADHDGGQYYYFCCTKPSVIGAGNIYTAPKFLADGIRPVISSPTVGAGTNAVQGTDIFGEVWNDPPTIGCAELPPAPQVSMPVFRPTGIPPGFTIGAAKVSGTPPFAYSWLKDGTPLADDSHFTSTQTSILVAMGASLADAGDYQLVAMNALGGATSTVVRVTIHCVDASGTSAVPPYLGWSTAATNIQDAIDACTNSDIVLVTNGLYASGGRLASNFITNRVTVDKQVLLQSINGPAFTIIQGKTEPFGINGLNATRCVWLGSNAVISGFTIRGGATRSYSSGAGNATMKGGGVTGYASAVVHNCLVVSNNASYSGGGSSGVTMDHCVIAENSGPLTGGGVAESKLSNCIMTNNAATVEGGGSYLCDARNSLFVRNRARNAGGGADYGTLVGCTIAYNVVTTPNGSAGGGAANAILTNCIVYGNSTTGSSAATNYYSCILSYCDSDPLPPGLGNINADPQLLGDGFHLAGNSPCIGAGLSGLNTGTDIEDQTWSSPPSMGCDQWFPEPKIAFAKRFRVGVPFRGLTMGIIPLGQEPLSITWFHDGVPVSQDATHAHIGTSNLVLKNFGPEASGHYDVVISNALGTTSSPVVDFVIHLVDAASTNPVAPYISWQTAATTIQDAIDAASAGDVVLVTNGIYSTGGKAVSGDLTNRVALDKPISVVSANGYGSTIIEGMKDISSGNIGPTAVRGAFISDFALLHGFTIRNGAVRNSGTASILNGGGVLCSSTNAIVSNCVISNNFASRGGGFSDGTLINSRVSRNVAAYGAGAHQSLVVNCTITTNLGTVIVLSGLGTYNCNILNSIVRANYSRRTFPQSEDNYGADSTSLIPTGANYSDITGVSGIGNITSDPVFLDEVHLAVVSTCRAAGNASYSSGVDIDGEPWSNPPSVGCDEVIPENLTGPVLVNLTSDSSDVFVGHISLLYANYFGAVSRTEWSFGDGTNLTNSILTPIHIWNVPGDYPVTFKAYNNDYPNGVSATLLIHAGVPNAPALFSHAFQNNTFRFSFLSQAGAGYSVQYTTNLTPPVVWSTPAGAVITRDVTNEVLDPFATNWPRFYRIRAF